MRLSKGQRLFIAEKRKAILEGRAYEDPALTASWHDMCSYVTMFRANAEKVLARKGKTVADMRTWARTVGYPDRYPAEDFPAVGPSLEDMCVIARYLDVPLKDLIAYPM